MLCEYTTFSNMKCNELLNHLPALKGQGNKTHENFPPFFMILTHLDLLCKTLSDVVDTTRSLNLQNEKMHLFLGIFPLFLFQFIWFHDSFKKTIVWSVDLF